MADAVLLKKDGSPADIGSTAPGDWFHSVMLGDTPTRRAQLAQFAVDNAGSGPWSLAEVTAAEYHQVNAIKNASVRAAAAAAEAALRDDYLSFRTKFALLFKSPQFSNILAANGSSALTNAELLAFEKVVLRDL